MNLTTAIILLFVGSAAFLTGMQLMSSGLKKSTGRGVKRLFKKTQDNRIVGVGIGASVTALIQSSAATAVIVTGFINAGVMGIFQGLSIIMGAFLGTTITGLLVSLSSLNFSVYLMLFAFIGVVISFFKYKIIKNIGEIFTGLGILFLGLEALKQGFGYSDITNYFASLFANINFPPLLLLIGIIATALVQSSSATTGIAIVMVTSGALNFDKGLYIAIGATIGTVVTTIIATIGGSVEAKRTALLAFISRILMGLLGLTIVWIFARPLSSFFLNAFESNGLSLALFTIFYNIIYLLLFLPILKPFSKMGNKIFKDKREEKLKAALKFIDNNMLNNPAVALMQVKREIENMSELSRLNLEIAFEMMMTLDLTKEKELEEREDTIDYINNAITDFLIKLSVKADKDEEKIIGSYFHVINDIERIGDHAINFLEMAKKMKESDLIFSDTAHKEFLRLYDVIKKMYQLANEVFIDNNQININYLHQLENETDTLKDELSTAHYSRLKTGNCKVELSPFYTSLVSELERVADHLTNIGYSFINPTGDDPNKLASILC